jgi:hypothetical protein
LALEKPSSLDILKGNHDPMVKKSIVSFFIILILALAVWVILVKNHQPQFQEQPQLPEVSW